MAEKRVALVLRALDYENGGKSVGLAIKVEVNEAILDPRAQVLASEFDRASDGGFVQ